MEAMYPAHVATVVVIVGAMLVVPMFLLATFVFSGASARRGLVLGSVWLVFGAAMTAVCLWGVPGRLGLAGNLIVPVAWIAPSALLFAFRRRVLAEPLSQRWLVGLQVWRVIGGVFLIEMTRGHVPSVFAWPAGLGDIAVGVLAAWVLWWYREAGALPRWAVLAVIVAGLADFAGAFFFGFTSAESPLQLFFPDPPSRLIEFPTGMIPMYLVPCAIFFHTLSWLSLKR